MGFMVEKKESVVFKAFKRVAKVAFYVSIAAFFTGAGLGVVALSRSSQAHAATESSYDSLRVLAEVMTLIQNYYVEEKTTKDLTDAAIRGLLRTLDPHSAFMDRPAYDSRKQETEGKFGGLGIEITMYDNVVVIVSPMEDTPAERAGLLAGDKIIKIDGNSTKDLDIVEAVKRMRGDIGTKVTITILREEPVTKQFDVTLTRANIKVRSVKYEMIDNEIGYVRIVSFTQNTASAVSDALKKFKDKKVKSLVLDLRNDPGGLLKEAVEVCELFLKEGTVVVSTRGRTPEQNSVFYSSNKKPFFDYPMVVLINAGSASASEIVAGAMKDTRRGIIMGARSFGKGSVQTVRELSDGSGLSLTTARYFTPAGIMIHGVGVSPDIEVKFKVDGKEVEGQEPMREKELMESFKGHPDGMPEPAPKPKDSTNKEGVKTAPPVPKEKPELGPRKVFNLEKDNQLQRAVEVLRDWDANKGILAEKKPAGGDKK